MEDLAAAGMTRPPEWATGGVGWGASPAPATAATAVVAADVPLKTDTLAVPPVGNLARKIGLLEKHKNVFKERGCFQALSL